jgi:Bacterial nucleoid DNA-binding protein
MNKPELIDAVADKSKLTKKDAGQAVDAVIDAITAALTAGDKVSLVGFGVFDVRERAERIGRNPKTKEEITIPASRAPGFKAGKALKDAIAK